MSKNAIGVSYDVHMMVAKKRLEIMENYGKKFDMSDIVDVCVLDNIDHVEELLGIVKSTRNIIGENEIIGT